MSEVHIHKSITNPEKWVADIIGAGWPVGFVQPDGSVGVYCNYERKVDAQDAVDLYYFKKGQKTSQPQQIRQFDSGATRDQDLDKFDFEGFLSPIVLNRFAQYMHKHRKQSDGQLRDSDNWQKGIPLKEYMKSGWRHFFDWWLEYRGHKSREGAEDALCGLMFNTMGYLYEILKEKNKEIDRTKPVPGGY